MRLMIVHWCFEPLAIGICQYNMIVNTMAEVLAKNSMPIFEALFYPNIWFSISIDTD